MIKNRLFFNRLLSFYPLFACFILLHVLLPAQAQKLEWFNKITNENGPDAIGIHWKNNQLQVVGNSYDELDFDPGAGTKTFNSSGYNAIYDTGGKPVTVGPIVPYILGRFGDFRSFDVDESGNYITCTDKELFFKNQHVGRAGDSSEYRKVALDAFGNYYVSGIIFGKTDVGNDKGAHFIYPKTPFLVPKNSSGLFAVMDTYIAKYSADGTLIYVKTFDMEEQLSAYNLGPDRGWNVYAEWLKDFITDNEGNLILFFGFNGSVNVDPGVSNHTVSTGKTALLTAKYDASGQYQWSNVYQGEDFQTIAVHSIAADPRNNELFLYFEDNHANTAIYKLNPDGNILAKSNFLGNISSDYFSNLSYCQLLISPTGELYISGRTYNFEFSPDVCTANSSSIPSTCFPTVCYKSIIAKLTNNLEFLWFVEVPATNGIAYFRGLTLDDQKNVYFCGSSEIDSHNMLLGKITPPAKENVFATCSYPRPYLSDNESVTGVCKGGTIQLKAVNVDSVLWFGSKCSDEVISREFMFKTNGLISDSTFFMANKNCPMVRFPVKVTLLKPSAAIYPQNIPTSACKGDTITLSAFSSNTDSVFWENGRKNYEKLVMNSTTSFKAYTLLDSLNCDASRTFQVEVFDPTLTLTNLTPQACTGDTLLIQQSNSFVYILDEKGNVLTTSDASLLHLKVDRPAYKIRSYDSGCMETKTIHTNYFTYVPSVYDGMNICSNSKTFVEGKGDNLQFTWSGGIVNGSKVQFTRDTTLTLKIESKACAVYDTFNLIYNKVPEFHLLKLAKCQYDTTYFSFPDGYGVYVGETRPGGYGYGYPSDQNYFVNPFFSDYILVPQSNSVCPGDTFRIKSSIPDYELSLQPHYDRTCGKDSILFLAKGKSAYFKWSDGIENGQYVALDTSHTYTLETFYDGCKAVDEIYVEVTKEKIDISFSSEPGCVQDSVYYRVNGYAPLIYLYNDQHTLLQPLEQQGYLPAVAGTYTVEASTNVCKSTQTYEFKDCSITGAVEAYPQDLPYLFPNPASSVGSVTLHGFRTGSRLEIRDMSGRTVLRAAPLENESVLLGKLTSGTYVVEIWMDDHTIVREKLVVY